MPRPRSFSIRQRSVGMVVRFDDRHMYPLKGETEQQFQDRMDKLQEERDSKMNDKEKELLAKTLSLLN